MKRLQICIYGGTDLQGMPAEFISALAYEVLRLMPATIVTGGFLHSREHPAAVSTDAAALRGARLYADEQRRDLRTCYEAWIPEPRLDGRRDVEGVVRMTDNDGITVRVIRGRTALGRRLAMVAGVDVVVTISGNQHTEVVVEQALELGVPVIPIPEAGGDSSNLLTKYHERIAASFDPGSLDDCLQKVSRNIHGEPQRAAEAVVGLIRTAKIGRCLVLLPYDEEHNALYTSCIEPAVAASMIPVRLDHLPKSEAIYTGFAEAVQTCSAVIADVTRVNENVMYEIGYAHGRALTPLLIRGTPAAWRICLSTSRA